jgi:hypothetical protein
VREFARSTSDYLFWIAFTQLKTQPYAESINR